MKKRTRWLQVLSLLTWLVSANLFAFDVQNLELRAQLTSQKGTMLSAEIPGRIQHIFFTDGQKFQAGDVLLEIDCRLQEAQRDRANAELMVAENVLAGQQRLAALNAISLTELRNSEAELIQAQADVRYLDVMMSRCQLTAPYDGRVLRFAVREHQSIQSAEDLVEIIDNEPLTVDFRVPSQWLAWFHQGYLFEVNIDDTARAYPAILLRTALRVDPISQTVLATGLIGDEFPELLPGMSGTVTITPVMGANERQRVLP